MLTAHIAAFLVARRADGLSPRTVEWYRWTLGKFADYVDGRPVDVMLVREFVADLIARPVRWVNMPQVKSGPLSAYTIRGYVRVLKSFFRWCCDDELIVVDPSVSLKIPKLPKRVPRGVSVDDLRVLLASANVRDRAVLLMLADCGLRVSELCGIRLQNLDLDGGVARVLGKGNAERFCFLSAPTIVAVKQWLDERATDSEWLFVGVHGERFKAKTVTEILRRLKKRTGVKGRCNPHAFRHGFAREYLMSGGDLASLSEILGHSDLQTTMIYSTFAQSELKEKHARHSPIATMEFA